MSNLLRLVDGSALEVKHFKCFSLGLSQHYRAQFTITAPVDKQRLIKSLGQAITFCFTDVDTTAYLHCRLYHIQQQSQHDGETTTTLTATSPLEKLLGIRHDVYVHESTATLLAALLKANGFAKHQYFIHIEDPQVLPLINLVNQPHFTLFQHLCNTHHCHYLFSACQKTPSCLTQRAF